MDICRRACMRALQWVKRGMPADRLRVPRLDEWPNCRARVKCGVRGAGKRQRVKCGEKFGESPRNLHTRTHIERLRPRVLRRAYQRQKSGHGN